MLVVERLIVSIAEIGTYQRQVFLTDYQRPGFLGKLSECCLRMQVSCILPSLIVVTEAAYHKPSEHIVIIERYLEVTHNIVGKIEFRHLIEQFVLINRVWQVCQNIHELCITLRVELSGIDRIAVCKNCCTSRPHIAKIKLTSMQRASFLHTIYYHTRHLSKFALREFLYENSHVRKTPSCISAI